MVGLNFGENHRNSLRVLVLQIIRENVLVHIAELVPHGSTRRTANLFHQSVHLFRRQEVHEQLLRLLVGPHDIALIGHLGDEVRDQALNKFGFYDTKSGHGV